MKINLPFNINEKKNWDYFSDEKNAKGGVWPLSNNGVWHTGIHFNAKERYSLISPLIPGEVVASRICKDYRDSPFNTKYTNSFVLMKHYFGSEKVPFYILYFGLASEKVIKEQEFNFAFKDNTYRPLFCRKWSLKQNSVDFENKRYVAYYSDKETTQVKGYFNRDGRYAITKCKNGFVYSPNESEQYFLKNNGSTPYGMSVVSDKNVKNLTYISYGKEASLIEVQVYYDSAYVYPKYKFNPTSLKKRLLVNDASFDINHTLDFSSTKDYEYTFDKSDFYIITKESLTEGKALIINEQTKLSNIEKFAKNKIKKNNNETDYVYVSPSSADNKPFKCFLGDYLEVISKVDTCGTKQQYKIRKTKTGMDLPNCQQNGYIKMASDKTADEYFSTLKRFDVRNSKNQNISQLILQNTVVVYDKPSESSNGLTLCPHSAIDGNAVLEIKKVGNCYFALIKVNKLAANYINPVLINESSVISYFYGYVKLNKANIKECISSNFNIGYNLDSVITEKFDDLPEDFNSPIAFFDNNKETGDGNDFELHMELFFPEFDKLTFSKKKKNSEGEVLDELIEIEKTENLYRSTNECQLKNADFIAFNKHYKYFIKSETKIAPLFAVEIDEINFILQKNKIIVLNQELRVKIERKDKSDRQKVTKIVVKENKDIGDYSFKKKEVCSFLCEKDEDGFDCYRLIKSISEINTGYSIKSDYFKDSTKDSPVELSDETIIYKGCKIEIAALAETDKVFTESQTLLYKNVDFYNINGENYIRFTSGGKNYYVKENSIENVKISSKYGETEQNTEGEKTNVESSKKYNVFDLPSFILLEDTKDDYICDINEISEKTGLKVQKEESIETLVYDENNTNLYQELNRLVIKCPSMWEMPANWDSIKSDFIRNVGYWGIEEERELELYSYLEDQFFITKENKSKIFGSSLKATKYYYFHPMKFLQYYTEKTIQEFNPYCGQVLVDLPSESVGGVDIVMNTLGFAPYTTNGEYSGYPISNGLFSENYRCVSTSYFQNFYHFYHEGIDLPASKGTEIKSFIYGKIVSWGWYTSYGRTTFIQSFDGKNLYLLAHQSNYMDNIAPGKIIAPGDVVGYVGTSGNKEKSYGAHLHITLYDIRDIEFTIDITNTEDKNKSFGDLQKWKISITKDLKNKLISLRRNPVNKSGKRDKND